MSHEIDLSKYEVRTDLIIEAIDKESIKNIDRITKEEDNIKVDSVTISKKNEKDFNKKRGNYITISFDDVTDILNQKKLEKVFKSEFTDFLSKMNILDSDKCLVVGLGNSNSTPDSLGPKVVDNIVVTKHLFDIDGIDVLDEYRNVSAIKPSVLALTGIETRDIIKGIISISKPDFLIIVDALSSSSISRVNKTIQITDTGISPGSGVGNNRGELSKDTLGIPVIGIGVPTVVDAVTIVSDTINFMMKKFSYSKKNIDSYKDKLKPLNKINYLDIETELSTSDKKKIMGEVGILSKNEIKQLIFEVLTPIGYNMMVTPKEVDFVIDKLSIVISNVINRSLHKNVKIID